MALHCSTILTSTASALLSHLSHLPTPLRSHAFFFTLSTNTPSSSLTSLIPHLSSFSRHTNIGCLSAPLCTHSQRDLIACSMVIFESNASRGFRSVIKGREEAMVGRWHNFRKGHDAGGEGKGVEALGEGENGIVDWQGVWGRSVGGEELPEEIRGLGAEDINSVLYLSDKSPEGLSNSLSAHLPNAIKLGLIASSTPFVTGRPVTLFHNDRIYSDGAVGLALTSPSSTFKIQYPNLDAITPPLTVTRVEGNLINELDDANPSQILIAAIRKAGLQGMDKDQEYFLGVVTGGAEPTQLYHILSGDPSRGTIALESHAAPGEGTTVQIYHRPSPTSPKPTEAKTGNGDRMLSFQASFSLPSTSPNTEETTIVLRDTFLSASENGFVVSRGGEVGWRCLVEGGKGSLQFRMS